jgi:hypothetical protein
MFLLIILCTLLHLRIAIRTNAIIVKRATADRAVFVIFSNFYLRCPYKPFSATVKAIAAIFSRAFVTR